MRGKHLVQLRADNCSNLSEISESRTILKVLQAHATIGAVCYLHGSSYQVEKYGVVFELALLNCHGETREDGVGQ